ncbi:hypothetical protein [Parasitella parasitica]|uniref:Uncharacterized protein n=1 Tax=Parasitella parasitica TaxID=35722 RepID=A0A0B7MZC6_9FUNG|nr:hypothetical protein [Parasitella parasitica]
MDLPKDNSSQVDPSNDDSSHDDSENSDGESSIQEKKGIGNSLLKKFRATVREVPVIVCACCGGLFFPSQVNQLSKMRLVEDYDLDPEFLDLVFCVPDTTTFCVTCSKYIKKGEVPSPCLSNDLWLPPIPDSIKRLGQD